MYPHVTLWLRANRRFPHLQVQETKYFTPLVSDWARLADLLPSECVKFDEKRPHTRHWPPSGSVPDLGDPARRDLSGSGLLRDPPLPRGRSPRPAPLSPVLGRLA